LTLTLVSLTKILPVTNHIQPSPTPAQSLDTDGYLPSQKAPFPIPAGNHK